MARVGTYWPSLPEDVLTEDGLNVFLFEAEPQRMFARCCTLRQEDMRSETKRPRGAKRKSEQPMPMLRPRGLGFNTNSACAKRLADPLVVMMMVLVATMVVVAVVMLMVWSMAMISAQTA